MDKNRESYYDNAKVILIFLVVFGHFIEPFIEVSNMAKTIFIFIYLFHMPTFIFISGYFSNTKTDKGWFIKLLNKFLIPYVVSQVTFIIFTKIIGLDTYTLNLITPAYIYWYLFAMFAWNFGIKILGMIKIKPEHLIIPAFIAGLLIGYIGKFGGVLSISRIVVFSPYFLLGYYFKENKISIKDKFKNKYMTIGCIVLISYVSLISINSDTTWLLCNTPYKYFNVSGVTAIMYRIIIYMFQIIAGLAFLNIVPNNINRYTYIGSKTLWIYLIHGFIVKLLVSIGFYNEYSITKFVLSITLSLVSIIFIAGLKRINYKKNNINLKEAI